MPKGTPFEDVAPDGPYVLFLQRTPAPPPSAIRFISGWLDTIKARAEL